MKKLIILSFLFSACATTGIITKTYNCAAFTPHGTYAHWTGKYKDDRDALLEAKTIVQRLIGKKLIPDTCVPVCETDKSIIFIEIIK